MCDGSFNFHLQTNRRGIWSEGGSDPTVWSVCVFKIKKMKPLCKCRSYWMKLIFKLPLSLLPLLAPSQIASSRPFSLRSHPSTPCSFHSSLFLSFRHLPASLSSPAAPPLRCRRRRRRRKARLSWRSAVSGSSWDGPLTGTSRTPSRPCWCESVTSSTHRSLSLFGGVVIGVLTKPEGRNAIRCNTIALSFSFFKLSTDWSECSVESYIIRSSFL